MTKSSVARVLIKLLLIFLVVTIYFYFQHPVQYRCTNLKTVFPIGDMTLVIDDIRISDLDEDKLSMWSIRGDKIPWLYLMIHKANLPIDWTVRLNNIVTFYTRLPRTDENANIEISGTLLYPADVRNPIGTDDHSILNQFDVHIIPGSVSGQGGNFTSGNNYCIVDCHGTFNLNDLNKELTLSITDEATNKVSYIYFTPRWEKERIWTLGKPWLEIDPVRLVESFIEQLKRNNTGKALEYVMPGVKKNFEFPLLDSSFKDADLRYTIEWVEYVVYYGAYKVTVEPGKFLNENRTDFEAATERKLEFYVARNNKDNKFYIVRVHEPYVPAQARINNAAIPS